MRFRRFWKGSWVVRVFGEYGEELRIWERVIILIIEIVVFFER